MENGWAPPRRFAWAGLVSWRIGCAPQVFFLPAPPARPFPKGPVSCPSVGWSVGLAVANQPKALRRPAQRAFGLRRQAAANATQRNATRGNQGPTQAQAHPRPHSTSSSPLPLLASQHITNPLFPDPLLASHLSSHLPWPEESRRRRRRRRK